MVVGSQPSCPIAGVVAEPPFCYMISCLSGMDIRPTIAVTKAHLKVAEIDEAVSAGRLEVDGKIVVKSPNMPPPPGHKQGDPLPDPGVEVDTSKAAVEPVWYLPGELGFRMRVAITICLTIPFQVSPNDLVYRKARCDVRYSKM